MRKPFSDWNSGSSFAPVNVVGSTRTAPAADSHAWYSSYARRVADGQVDADERARRGEGELRSITKLWVALIAVLAVSGASVEATVAAFGVVGGADDASCRARVAELQRPSWRPCLLRVSPSSWRWRSLPSPSRPRRSRSARPTISSSTRARSRRRLAPATARRRSAKGAVRRPAALPRPSPLGVSHYTASRRSLSPTTRRTRRLPVEEAQGCEVKPVKCRS